MTSTLIPSALMIRVVRAGATGTVVGLRGEADVSTVSSVADVLARVIASHSGDVVVDLAHLEFIDSATVRVLADAHRLLLRHGRRLTVRSPSRLAGVVLSVFGLTDLIESGRTS